MNTRLLFPATLSIALAMCGPIARADEAAELNDLPAAVQKTARAQVGTAEVNEVEPTYEDGQHATEIEYRVNGKQMAAVIAKDGTLIQTEYRMSPKDAPAVITAAVSKKYPEGTITHVQEVARADGKFYEISVKSGGKSHRFDLDEGGKPVKKD
jgi:hypothetical protein